MTVRRLLEILALVVATLFPTYGAAANTFGTDFSDLWWNPLESGWGANLVHQGDTVFMTLYVYGPDSKPKWYVASYMPTRGGETSHAFDGTLYEATGTYLGAPIFDSGSVTMQIVGTASLEFSTISVGTLTYNVGGVSVTKRIERQTFRNNNLSGSYFGAQVGTKTSCGTSSGTSENTALYSIVHNGSEISITAVLSDNLYCTYSGTYVQQGRMGQIEGGFSCTNGSKGGYFAAGIEASDKGFLGRFFADFGGGCVELALIGGVKR